MIYVLCIFFTRATKNRFVILSNSHASENSTRASKRHCTKATDALLHHPITTDSPPVVASEEEDRDDNDGLTVDSSSSSYESCHCTYLLDLFCKTDAMMKCPRKQCTHAVVSPSYPTPTSQDDDDTVWRQ